MKTKISITLLLLMTLSGCDKLSTGESKRFQIVSNPHARADTFLLDTQKGKVWQLTKITDVESQPTVWEPMNVIDPEGDIGITPKVFLERYPFEKKK